MRDGGRTSLSRPGTLRGQRLRPAEAPRSPYIPRNPALGRLAPASDPERAGSLAGAGVDEPLGLDVVAEEPHGVGLVQHLDLAVEIAGLEAEHELEDLALPTIEVADTVLADLGKARAQKVQELLLGSGDIDPSRLFIVNAGPAPGDAGLVRMDLALRCDFRFHFKSWLLDIARKVANAATEGGFFGFGGQRVSAAETAAINELASSLAVKA